MPLPAIPIFLKLFGLFAKLKAMVVTAVSAVVQVAIKYPVQTVVVVALAIGGYFFYNFAYDRGAASKQEEVTALQTQLAELGKQIEERNKRVVELEARSTQLAEALTTSLTKLQEDLAGIKDSYARNLEEALKNPKVVTRVVEVKVPGQDRIVEVMVQNGNVVCDRYPEGYTQTINQAVDRTIQTMREGKAP